MIKYDDVKPSQGSRAKAMGCRHSHTRFGTPAQCADCPARSMELAKPGITRPAGSGGVLNSAGVRDAPNREQVAAIAGVKATVNGIDPADLSQEDTVIDGAFALDFTAKVLDLYARWNSPEEIALTAAWIAHTWFTDTEGTLALPASPRWLIVGAPESGKTRKLRLIRKMARNAIGPVQGTVSAPGVRNAMHNKRTLVLDETQRVFGRGSRREDLQGILTGGYTPEAETLNAKDNSDEDSKDIFGPIAMGALPRIITGTSDMLEDLFTRCFTVTATEYIPRSPGDVIPDLDSHFEQATGLARNILGLWAAQERTGETLWPVHSVPDVLKSRKREITIPLLAVADRAVDPELVREEGSDLRWAKMTRRAARAILLGQGDPETVMAKIRDMYEMMGGNDPLKGLTA